MRQVHQDKQPCVINLESRGNKSSLSTTEDPRLALSVIVVMWVCLWELVSDANEVTSQGMRRTYESCNRRVRKSYEVTSRPIPSFNCDVEPILGNVTAGVRVEELWQSDPVL